MTKTSSDITLLRQTYVHLDNDQSNFRHLQAGEEVPAAGYFSKVANGCCKFTNDGRVGVIGLLNGCGVRKLVKIEAYNAGRHIATRYFHLERAEYRDIRSVGDLEYIDTETDWDDSVQGDDGSNWALLVHTTQHDGQVLWEVRNENPRYYNAVEIDVFLNGARHGYTFAAVAPGTSRRIFAFLPNESGFCFLRWARLDPT